MNAKIALNMSMVKFVMWEKGPDYTFERVKKAGVSYFELSQVDMTDEFIDAAIAASKKHGVEIIASSVNYQPLFGGKGKGLDLETDFDRLVEINHKLGVKYIRDSLMPRSCVHSESGFHKFAEVLNHYGKRLKEEGIHLYYHNHHFEFEKFNGKTGFEILFEETDPEYVGFEPDVHWIQRAGEDPVKWIKKLAGREDLVHLKDFRIMLPDIDQLSADLFHHEACIQFAEIGEGNLDMKTIIEESLKNGAKYLPVEQDDCYGRDPFDCLANSVENIKKMGFSDLL